MYPFANIETVGENHLFKPEKKQNLWSGECLNHCPIDFLILILIFLILFLFALTGIITLVVLFANLGVTTFSVISDTANGVIDLGVPEGVNLLHFAAKAGNTKGFNFCFIYKRR